MAKREIAGLTVYEVADVAREIGVTPATVRRWIKDGKLVARKIGRGWIVTEEAVRLFVAGVEPAERDEREGSVGFQPQRLNKRTPPKGEAPTEPPVMIPMPPKGNTVTS